MYAESFNNLTKKYPISKEIQEQYNTQFVDEFITIFRPDMVKYLKNLQRHTGNKMETIEIDSPKRLAGTNITNQ